MTDTDLANIPVFAKMQKDDCCGCEVCANVCPNGAITMVEDTEGFNYPRMNNILCVGCNRCVSNCPVLHTTKNELLLDTYVGYANNPNHVQTSSSGGIFGLLAEAFLESDGQKYICAVIWKEDFRGTVHMLSNKIEDLHLMKRSKYIQSIKGTVYREIEQKLRQNARVLFTGCPCEVAGLKNYLNNNYSEGNRRLYTVDLVCQGPTSPKAMCQFVDQIEKKYHSIVQNINMRYVIGKWIPQYIKINFSNGKQFIEYLYDTDIGRAVHIMQRPSCYQCHFVGTHRLSDITLGDYHGADPAADYYNETGTSIVVVNTDKGQQMFELFIKNKANLFLVKYDDVAKPNQRLIKSWAQHPKRKQFANDLAAKGLKKAVKNSLTFKRRVKQVIPPKYRQYLQNPIKVISAFLRK